METGLNVRPVQTTSVAPVRVEPAPQRQVARTELPESQAVPAVNASRPVQTDQSDLQKKLRADLNRTIDVRVSQPRTKVDLDQATNELVFRKLSPSTGRVVQQFPDEAIMRQRAYAVQQRRAELETSLEGRATMRDDRVEKTV